jgi:hypothetical protein
MPENDPDAAADESLAEKTEVEAGEVAEPKAHQSSINEKNHLGTCPGGFLASGNCWQEGDRALCTPGPLCPLRPVHPHFWRDVYGSS